MPDEVVQKTAIKGLEYFEKKYTCSGFCNTGLFFYSLDVAKGIPEDSCLIYLKAEINDSLLYLGIASIVCGILMCLVFVVQYALWCPYGDESNVPD